MRPSANIRPKRWGVAARRHGSRRAYAEERRTQGEPIVRARRGRMRVPKIGRVGRNILGVKRVDIKREQNQGPIDGCLDCLVTDASYTIKEATGLCFGCCVLAITFLCREEGRKRPPYTQRARPTQRPNERTTVTRERVRSKRPSRHTEKRRPRTRPESTKRDAPLRE